MVSFAVSKNAVCFSTWTYIAIRGTALHAMYLSALAISIPWLRWPMTCTTVVHFPFHLPFYFFSIVAFVMFAVRFNWIQAGLFVYVWPGYFAVSSGPRTEIVSHDLMAQLLAKRVIPLSRSHILFEAWPATNLRAQFIILFRVMAISTATTTHI